MTYIFLDTNIFLHFKSFLDIDWPKFTDGDEYIIMIAPTVLDELDNQKTHTNKKIAGKAKNAIEKLEKVENGDIQFKLAFITHRPSDGIFNANKLIRAHADDGLFASIIEHEIGEGDKKILITNDLGVKVRSKPLGIRSIKLPDEYRLAEELNDDEKELLVLKKEVSELKNRLPKVSLVFGDNTNRLNYFVDKKQSDWQEYLWRESVKNKKNYAKWETPVDTLASFGITIGNKHNHISPEQITSYNIALDIYYSLYEKYLVQEFSYNNYLLRSIEISVSLTNTGTLPAEDTDVYLHFPDGFDLVKKLADPPEKPDPPSTPRSLFESPIRPNLGFPGRSIESMFTKPDPNAPYLSRLDKTNSYEVEFKVPVTKHNMKVPLQKLYACFESAEVMKSFKVEYSLKVANLPKEEQGELHIIIDKGNEH